MKLEEAEQYTKELIAFLRPYTERIEVAGSIRRRKPEPNDIELVVVPRLEPILGTEFAPIDMFHKRLEECIKYGFIQFGDPSANHVRAAFGKKYYKLKYQGQQLDIFVVLAPAQFGPIFLLRTGDADFSHEIVSYGWDAGIHFTDGHLVMKNGDIPDTPEEGDVFEILGVPFIAPEQRNKETILEQRRLHFAAPIGVLHKL